MLLKSTYTRILIVIIFIFVTVFACGTIKLPVVINDGKVFQRDTKFPVYGWAPEKEKVILTHKEKNVQQEIAMIY